MSDSESDEPDEIPQSLFDRIGEMIYTSLGGRPPGARITRGLTRDG